MADQSQQDFNRSALTVDGARAWYTGQRADKIPGGLVHVVGFDCLSLDLSYNELTSLIALKKFVCLQELILDNNHLRDLKTLPHIPTLTTLSLNKNKLWDMDSVLNKISECCPKITYVSLLGNPGCPDQLTNPTSTDEDDYERYRLYAIYVLPETLRFLDFRPVSNTEKKEARHRGRYSRTIKLDSNVSSNNFTRSTADEFNDIAVNVNYTPLPACSRNLGDHRGAYGKCKYRYSGKNSEGNRFISNNDL